MKFAGQTLALVLAAAALAACATRPENIAPLYVADAGYQSMDCSQLTAETTRLDYEYHVAARHQLHVRDNDRVSMMMFGVPVASLTGHDFAPEVAKLKGQQEAVRRVMTAKSCAVGAGPAAT